MRLDDYRSSDNVQDDRGAGGWFGFGGGFGGGGGLFGLLFGLVLSRFGIVGVLILLLGYCTLSSLGGGNLGVGGSPAIAPHAAQTAGAGQGCAADAQSRLSCQVLASTEDTWGQLFARSGQSYSPTTLVFYSRSDQSGCGAAQSAMGPFYCPTDRKIYLDTGFFQELTDRFHAAGDFAQAYVIGHEVGHHVQDLLGTLRQAEAAQSRASRAEANALQVQIELQADCYAGVWAANAKAANGQPIMEPGDAEEGMRAAEAIGDDTLQRQAQGYVVPESFTHGTSAQRMAALRKGLQTGDPAACERLS